MKAFRGYYFDIWAKPGVDEKIMVPRNARCWCIFQRACYYIGHPEYIQEVTDAILKYTDRKV